MGKSGKKSSPAAPASLSQLLLGGGPTDSKAASLFDTSNATKFERIHKPVEVPLRIKRRQEEEAEAAAKTKKGKVRPARPLKSEKEAKLVVIDPRAAQAEASKPAKEGKSKPAKESKEAKPPKADEKPSAQPVSKKEKKQKGAEEKPAATPESKAAEEPKAEEPQGKKKKKKQKKPVKEAVAEEKEEEEEVGEGEEASEAEEEEEEEEEEEVDSDEERRDAAERSGFAHDDEEDKYASPEDEEKNSRTVFVGNLPVTVKKAHLMTLFKPAGEIESVRLRSIAVVGTKIDQHGNQSLVRKVSANKKLFATEVKDTCNAYVVFKSASSIAKAVLLNNSEFQGKHLRIDHLGRDSSKDYQRSAFLGNLPFDIKDEEVREHFAALLEDGQGGIEGVRIVRDPETQVGKGFGFLLLKDSGVLAEVLRAGEQKIRNRTIRITTCGRRMKAKGSGKGDKARPSFEGRRGSDAVSAYERRKLKAGGVAAAGIRLKKRAGSDKGGKKKGKKGGKTSGPKGGARKPKSFKKGNNAKKGRS